MALESVQFPVLAEVFGKEKIEELVGSMNRLESATVKHRQAQEKAVAANNSLSASFGEAFEDVTGVSLSLAGAATTIGATVAAVVVLTRDVIALGEQFVTLSNKTDLSLKSLQELKFIAGQTNLPFESLANAVLTLGQRASAELPATVATIRALGLSLNEVQAQDPGTRFFTIAEALGSIENPAKRAELSVKAFGSGLGKELLPAFKEDLSALREEFHALGGEISENTLRAGESFNDNIGKLTTTMTALKAEALGPVVELLVQLTDITVSATKEVTSITAETNAWVDAASRLFDTIGSQFPLFRNWVGEIEKLVDKIKLLREIYNTFGLGATVENALKTLPEHTAAASVGLETFTSSVRTTDDILNQSTDDLLKWSKTVEKDQNEAIKKGVVELDKGAKAHEQYRKEVTATIPMIRELRNWNLQAAEVAALYADTIPIATKETYAMAQSMGVWAVTNAEYVVTGGQANETTRETVDVMGSVGDALSEARGLMTLFGIESDSVFGKVLGWVSKAFDAFNSLTGIIGKIAGLFGGGGSNVLGAVTGGGGGGSSILGGLGRLLGIGGGAAASVGTAAAGAIPVAGSFAGAGLSATVGGGAAAGGAGLGALAATGYGAIAVAAIFAIRAALKKASAETTAEFLGIDFDVLSEGFQDQLQKMGKATGDFATAIQLNLGQVFAEGGVSDVNQAEKLADTFSFLERKQIDATQAQQILNGAVGQVIPTIGQMGAEGVFQLERLLAAAEQTGVQFDGMSDLAVAYVQRANELGVAVNNVVLQALGLDAALAELAKGNPLGGLVADANSAANAIGRAAAAAEGFIPGGGERFDGVAAQHGLDRWFSRPTRILVGEAGPEHVKVTPQGKSSGGGGSVVMNITIDARGAQHGVGDEIAAKLANVIGRGRNPGGIDVAIKRVMGR